MTSGTPDPSAVFNAASAAPAAQEMLAAIRADDTARWPALLVRDHGLSLREMLQVAAAHDSPGITGLVMDHLAQQSMLTAIPAAQGALTEAIRHNALRAFSKLLDPRIAVNRAQLWRHVALSGRTEMMQKLSMNEKNLRSKTLQDAFVIACHNGHALTTGAWMMQQYAGQLRGQAIATAAHQIMGRAPAAEDIQALHWLIDRLQTLPPQDSQQRTAVKKMSLRAATRAPVEILDRLLDLAIAQGSQADGRLLGAAAKACEENGLHILRRLHPRGVISQQDLDMALVVSASENYHALSAQLLAVGADAQAYNSAALRHAAEACQKNSAIDSFSAIENLLRHGANPAVAAAAVEADTSFASRFRIAADAAQRQAQEKFFALCGAPPEIEKMAQPHAALNTTGLHFAAAWRFLPDVLTATPALLAHADLLLQADARGLTPLDHADRAGQLPAIFAPHRWAGRAQDAERLVAALPEGLREKVQAPAFLYEVNVLNLKEKSRKSGLKLKL